MDVDGNHPPDLNDCEMLLGSLDQVVAPNFLSCFCFAHWNMESTSRKRYLKPETVLLFADPTGFSTTDDI